MTLESEHIRVAAGLASTWSVLKEPHSQHLRSFNTKSHALAYARAVSFSRKLVLFVDDVRGLAVRQTSASLTYPIYL